MDNNHKFGTLWVHLHIPILQIVFRIFYFEFLLGCYPHMKQNMIPMSSIHSIDNQLEKKVVLIEVVGFYIGLENLTGTWAAAVSNFKIAEPHMHVITINF